MATATPSSMCEAFRHVCFALLSTQKLAYFSTGNEGIVYLHALQTLQAIKLRLQCCADDKYSKCNRFYNFACRFAP